MDRERDIAPEPRNPNAGPDDIEPVLVEIEGKVYRLVGFELDSQNPRTFRLELEAVNGEMDVAALASTRASASLRALIAEVYRSGIEHEPDYWGSTGGDKAARDKWVEKVVDGYEPRFRAALRAATDGVG